MFFRKKQSGPRTYLQIVENRWEGGVSKQRVVATLGRLDKLNESGQLDALLRSGARLADTAILLSALREGDLEELAMQRIGPALIFERLWKETGCRQAVEGLLAARKYEFSVERAVFLTVLHRLFDPGSDRACEKWKEDYRIEGAAPLRLHHLYRAMAWLGEPLPEAQQLGKTRTERCVKDLIEERLFDHRRDLFSSLDVVFFDTTSIYFEGRGGPGLGKRGKSKDHRPDLPQMVVGIVIDGKGRPICCELWPGNATDVKSLIPIVDRLRNKFSIGRICVVADRGMISREVIGELEADQRQWLFILGTRMRSYKEVREQVLADTTPFEEVRPARRSRSDPSPLAVKGVEIEGRRYVVCFNEDQAKKDAADREAIVESLHDQLRQGAKSLVGNKGYRKYLRSTAKAFAVDEEKIAAESRFDGLWVLRTNTALSNAEVALKYKELWMVEQLFRSLKSVLITRPIYHSCTETIRGHAFCSFLALVVLKELFERLEKRDEKLEWNDMLRDLNELQEVLIQQDGKRLWLRSDLKGCCGKVLQATGVAVPPALRAESSHAHGATPRPCAQKSL